MAKPAAGLGLGLSLLIYLGLCFSTVRSVGVVGEVALSGVLAKPPLVLLQVDPPETGEQQWGPLVARVTRPTESFRLGDLEIPLAVNAYTGGPADWPVWLVSRLAGAGSATAVVVALGALLLTLSHRFLRFHGSDGAPAATALWLASDWSFVFYRKVLGGTEVLLQAAGLLLLWALWSRRWKGGAHGTMAIAFGVGLGLLAKITFVGTLLAVGCGVLLTRWDRAPMRPPVALHRGWFVAIPLLCVAPLLLAALHHLQMPLSLPSHDSLDLQWARLLAGLAGEHADREGFQNLGYFLGNPLGFFHAAYGAEAQPLFSVARLVSFAGILWGSVLAWRDPQAPAPALLRFLSIVVPLQILFLFLLNHDLHHLAQSTVFLAIWGGLAADRVAATLVPRGVVRSVLASMLVLPAVFAGIHHLWKTDAVVEQILVPTFTEVGQTSLVEMLRRAGVRELVVADYESYGMLEIKAPEIAVTHVWAAVARHTRGTEILTFARGHYFLSVRASQPMIYNWDPEPDGLRSTAKVAGVGVELVDQLMVQGQPTAWLWRIQAAPAGP